MRLLAAGSTALLLACGVLVASPSTSAAAAVTCQGRKATIVATPSDRRLRGTDGPDVISTAGFERVTVDAGAGDDLICAPKARGARIDAGPGDDRVVTEGESTVRGGDGDDVLVDRAIRTRDDDIYRAILDGGPGRDTLRGGPETIATYASSDAPVAIDMREGTAADGTWTDRLAGIRRVIGSNHDDTYRGTHRNDYYKSWGGADVVRSGAGDDYVVVATWSSSVGGVDSVDGLVEAGPGDDVVQAANSTVRAGAGDDAVTIVGHGVARGGRGADQLDGRLDYEDGDGKPGLITLYGGPGRDRLFVPGAFTQGGASCPSLCAISDLDGGPGIDVLDLSSKMTFVFRRDPVADLAAGTASHLSGRATVTGVEDVEGSRFGDVITGDDGPNHLDGNGGDDVLVGGGGNDILHGHAGADRADGGDGRDVCVAESRASCERRR